MPESPAAKADPAPAAARSGPDGVKNPAPAPAVAAEEIASRFPDAARIVAIGDVHGDLTAARTALKLAGAIDDQDRWIGGDLVVVQTGDQLDRGDEEQAIIDLFEDLRARARAAGGAFHVLNGNHEIMNVAGDLRYVTPGGFADFADVPGLVLDDPALARVPPGVRPRAAAFRPGGPYARILGNRNVVVIVGDTVFAHGGVLPAHANGLEQINARARAWMRGEPEGQGAAEMLMAPDSPVWTRLYSDNPDEAACATLEQTLRALKVERMVVGHTVQREGITSACDEQVWRVDVGMAAHYGGTPQVLEIQGDQVRALR
jgi:hypothetical protein